MKKTQQQLKAEFLKELETTSSRRNSQKMVDYIFKNAVYFVELHDWGIFYIEKPKIETRFCFWYSDSPYDNKDRERANKAEEYARTNEDYFLEENLEDINRDIEELKHALNSENLRNTKLENFYILKHHWNWDLETCKIRSFEILDKYEAELEKMRLKENEIEEMTRQDLENRLEGLEIVKAQFIKRLNTYLKRYWLEKLHTWTYWRDA